MELELISAQIARLELKPEDTLVIRGKGPMTWEVARSIKEYVVDITKHTKVLVFGDDVDLSVITGDAKTGGGV